MIPKWKTLCKFSFPQNPLIRNKKWQQQLYQHGVDIQNAREESGKDKVELQSKLKVMKGDAKEVEGQTQ